MKLSELLIVGALMVGAVGLANSAAWAAFIVVDNFNDLILGPINDQNDWRAGDDTSEVIADPADAANQVLSVATVSTRLYHAATIPQGESRMLFLRFRYEDQLSVSFGMSNQIYPFHFGDFEVELSLTSTNDDLRINDDGSYTELASIEPGRWYNCWLYIDNDADVTHVWLHDRPQEPATAADQLTIDGQTAFSFRSGASNDLQNFFIKTGGGDGVVGPLRLDDIYVQNTDALDLSYPADIVSGVGATPAGLTLHGARPNPFNPQTMIAFTLDETQLVKLAVYDLSGRLVRLLGAGEWEAGPHVIPWNGRNQSGAAVASGVYVVRLAGRREVLSAKLVLTR